MNWIYHTTQRLFFLGLMPKRVWWFVYDHLHRKVKEKW